MKIRALVSALLLSIYGTKAVETTQRSLPFQCPNECRSTEYEPICSRGKSYANLCILRQQICKGEEALEVWKDVEACPKYTKDEDVTSASVEAIDKNGVVYRHFFDIVKNKRFRPVASPPPERRPRTNEYVKRSLTRAILRGKQDAGKTSRPIFPQLPCINQEIRALPGYILGPEISSFCAGRTFYCYPQLPTWAILVAKPCENFASRPVPIFPPMSDNTPDLDNLS